MKLIINGNTYDVADEPPRPLLWILRDELGLTGTRFGCGIGYCGSCTIHVDGVATRACVTPLNTVAGRELRTIEGLALNGEQHPVERAFLDEELSSCGWCINGQVMTAAAFLEANPNPTQPELMAALSANVCRCGAYPQIRRALCRAAEFIAQDQVDEHAEVVT